MSFYLIIMKILMVPHRFLWIITIWLLSLNLLHCIHYSLLYYFLRQYSLLQMIKTCHGSFTSVARSNSGWWSSFSSIYNTFNLSPCGFAYATEGSLARWRPFCSCYMSTWKASQRCETWSGFLVLSSSSRI
jgi:hypothetical protein